MDGGEVLAGDLDAHLDADVVLLVDVPGAGVADHVAVRRLVEQRALPEGLGQRRHAERGEEPLAVADHGAGIDSLPPQQTGQIDARRAARGRHQVVDVAPALGPHVAQQMGRNRPLGGYHVGAVEGAQAAAHVAVQLLVERPDLLPEALDLGGELVRRHVVLGAPHRAQVVEAELAGALVAELGEALVVGAHRRRDSPPAGPGLELLCGVAARGEHPAELAQITAFAVFVAVLALAVGAFHARRNPGQLGPLLRVAGGRQGERQSQQIELARLLRRQLEALVAGRLLGQLHRRRDVALVGLCRQDLGVVGDERRLHPATALDVDEALQQGGFRPFEKLRRVGSARRPLDGARWAACRCQRHETEQAPQWLQIDGRHDDLRERGPPPGAPHGDSSSALASWPHRPPTPTAGPLGGSAAAGPRL